MTPYLFGVFSFLAWIAFAIPTLVFLLRLYTRTRMTGFMWLVTALVAWPVLARVVSFGMPMFAAATGIASSGLFGVRYLSVYTLILLVESLVGGALLLMAVFTLDREMTARMEPRPSAPPPATVV